MSDKEIADWIEQTNGWVEFSHAPVALGGFLQEVKIHFDLNFSGTTFMEAYEKAYKFFTPPKDGGNVLMMFCKQRAVETGFTSAPNHMELHHIQGFIDWLCDTHKRFSKYAGPIDAIRAVD